jgi:hypothetical protein
MIIQQTKQINTTMTMVIMSLRFEAKVEETMAIALRVCQCKEMGTQQQQSANEKQQTGTLQSIRYNIIRRSLNPTVL